MQISSPAFVHNQPIPSKYTCDGENISPPLQFTAVPQDTQSLVLIVDDPDAPSGNWVHWVVYNISPITTDVPEHKIPYNGEEGVTNFGNNRYGGPCPPSGNHRYIFTLYALDTQLQFLPSETVDKAIIETKIQGHILDQAQLIGTYSR